MSNIQGLVKPWVRFWRTRPVSRVLGLLPVLAVLGMGIDVSGLLRVTVPMYFGIQDANEG